MKEEELNDLKYRQLQKLAKDHGIKANLPKAALIEELLKATNKTVTDFGTEAKTDEKSEENVQKINEPSEIVQDQPSSSRRGSKRKSVNNENVAETITELEPEKVETNDKPVSSRRGSKRKSQNDENVVVMEAEANDKPVNSRRGSKRKSQNEENEVKTVAKKSFDKSVIEAEVAKLEDMTNKILEQPRKRSRNSSSMFKASAQVDTSSGSGSRRTSRLSFFDKEAFDVEAAKVSKYAQNILDSPRRSSILNLNSPRRSSILNLTPSKTIRDSPLVKTETKKTAKKVTLNTGIPRPRKVPDFAKLHAKQFGKMDTLGSYLEKKEKRMAALTPGAKKAKEAFGAPSRRSPRDHVKTNLNFGPSKPFVFKAGNQVTTKPSTFKPYTGKVQPLNKTSTLKTHQQKANRALGGQNIKEKQMSIIKGVRMNKRMELMLQKRNLK